MTDAARNNFPWFYDVDPADPDVHRWRAQHWILGPFARLRLEARVGDREAITEVVALFDWAIAELDVRRSDSPTDMEAWLTGLLDGCAASVLRRRRG